MTAAVKASATRRVTRVVDGMATSDGAGVALTRIIGTPGLSELDPFLLLDAFHSDDPKAYIAGFPDHPHRGFETVTYMLAGRMRHRDNKGHSGLLEAGGVQWMTAGRGIVHSEMPEQQDGLMSGFQLWINLPAKTKMSDARYLDVPAADIPVVTTQDGATVKVIAGEFGGERGPVDPPDTAPVYLDIALPSNAILEVPLPATHAALAYVFEGAADIGPDGGSMRIRSRQLAVLGAGDAVMIRAGDAATRLIVIAGAPLDEPIARYGPFVMNTQAEIRQAITDYQAGRL